MTLYSLGIGERRRLRKGPPIFPMFRCSKATRPRPKFRLNGAPSPQKRRTRAMSPRLRSAFPAAYFDACQSASPQDESFFTRTGSPTTITGRWISLTSTMNSPFTIRMAGPEIYEGDSLRVVRTGTNTVVKVRVAFQVANLTQNRKASGRTDDILSVAKRGDSLEIVSVKEARVRRPLRRLQRRPPPNFPKAVGRTVKKVFRSIFH